MKMPGQKTCASGTVEILCADDSPVNLKLLSAILVKNGFSITCVNDGAEALALLLLCPNRFDVLITDHDMPRMNGLTLISEAKKLGFRGRIILNSATITENDLRSYAHKSIVVLLGKPVNPQRLLKVIGNS